jgi:hypothetical protein
MVVVLRVNREQWERNSKASLDKEMERGEGASGWVSVAGRNNSMLLPLLPLGTNNRMV